jgi:hypothetical protein
MHPAANRGACQAKVTHGSKNYSAPESNNRIEAVFAFADFL